MIKRQSHEFSSNLGIIALTTGKIALAIVHAILLCQLLVQLFPNWSRIRVITYTNAHTLVIGHAQPLLTRSGSPKHIYVYIVSTAVHTSLHGRMSMTSIEVLIQTSKQLKYR